MKKISLVILFCLLSLCLSLSGCSQSRPLPVIQNDTMTFDSPHFGISLHYPNEWTVTTEEGVCQNPMNYTYQRFQFKYTDNTTGSFLISGSRSDCDPTKVHENFTGSEECAFWIFDDRPNLTVSESYQPVSVGGVKARRFIDIFHEPGMETVETRYDICKTYKTGPGMIYKILWRVPSEEFFKVKPDVQEVVDSIRIYYPV